MLLDKDRHIIGVLAGEPQGDETWDRVVEDATAALNNARELAQFSLSEREHRHGDFFDLSTSQAPGPVYNPPEKKAAVESLIQDPAIRRVAGFGNSAVAMFAPKVYRYVASNITG